jgi:hypothetical protein
MSAEAWAVAGTIIGTLVLVVVPAFLLSWIVLEEWIGSPDRYPDV